MDECIYIPAWLVNALLYGCILVTVVMFWDVLWKEFTNIWRIKW